MGRCEGPRCPEVNIKKNWFQTAVLITCYIRKSAVAMARSGTYRTPKFRKEFNKRSVIYIIFLYDLFYNSLLLFIK